jgi:hypothetical protein
MPIVDDLLALRTTLGVAKPKIFVTGSDATGDITHVFAAYKAAKVAGLVIFPWAAASAPGMEGKYTALGIPAARIKIVDPAAGRPTGAQLQDSAKAISNPPALNGDQRNAIAAAAVPNLATRNGSRDYVTALCKALKFSVEPLHKSTEFAIAALQNEVTRKELHVDLRGTKGLTESDAPLIKFWNDKLVTFDHDVVVLWGRWSGKKKTTGGVAPNLGPHLYGDSSTTGLVQLANKCKVFAKVVVAGDVDKLKQDRFQDCVYIGEFWNDLKKDPYNIPEVTQKIQIRTFYVLKQLLQPAEKRLVHVGMRSGTLDNYAFAGQTILYLVPVGFDDTRIAQLASASKRWNQSFSPESPRVAYRKNLALSPELINVVQRTDLRLLTPPNTERFAMLNKSLGENSYPIDPDTQLNANILYRAIKEAVKADPSLDGENALQSYTQAKRGLEDYLNQLVAKIKGGLKKVG